jgi:hypothetical protein
MRGCSQGAVVLFVLSLLLSSAQCMMACAVAPCQPSSQNNLPPCHQHPAPANHTPSACIYPAAVVDAGHSRVAPDLAAVALFPPVDCLLPSHSIEEAAILHTGSPPGIIQLSTVILRV